ncbi:DUF167 domain-containing protein [Nanoarchaeota archaeon]|nr:MAG: DUF167 domain-containing protein [Nanoarchaeota archaeon]
MRIKIRVIPNASKNEIIEGETLTVKTTEPAKKNKANKAVVRMLKNYFKADVKIIAGFNSRNKLIEINQNI